MFPHFNLLCVYLLVLCFHTLTCCVLTCVMFHHFNLLCVYLLVLCFITLTCCVCTCVMFPHFNLLCTYLCYVSSVPRNYDPSLHPFEVPREYVRAVNMTKLERVFAKPFLGSLDGHRDGIHRLCTHPTSLSHLLSGACDGEVGVPCSLRLVHPPPVCLIYCQGRAMGR